MFELKLVTIVIIIPAYSNAMLETLLIGNYILLYAMELRLYS